MKLFLKCHGWKIIEMLWMKEKYMTLRKVWKYEIQYDIILKCEIMIHLDYLNILKKIKIDFLQII